MFHVTAVSSGRTYVKLKKEHFVIHQPQSPNNRTQRPLRPRNKALSKGGGGMCKCVLTAKTAKTARVLPRKQLILRKADLLNSKTQLPLKLHNKALLSLDGGGLRGILTGVILEDIERVIKDVIIQDRMLPLQYQDLQPHEWSIELADYFECVSGTSAGAMLALYIASKGGTAFQASQDWLPQDQWGDRPLQEGSIALAWRIIRARAEQIFTPPWQQFLRFRSTDWYRALFPFASGFFWAKYSAAGIEETLQVLMGTELKLSELHTSVIIPSYELEASSPFTFWHKHSPTASNRDTGYIAMVRSEDFAGKDSTEVSGGAQLVKGRDFKLWEVARASSAAPTFFPAAIIDTTPGEGEATMRTFVDGGLIANNPTIQGLTFMAGAMEFDMDRIAVLSIGTGSAIRDLRKGMLKSGGRGWGMLEWILPNEGNIVTTIMDGSSEASQAIVDIFFKTRVGSIHSAGKSTKKQHSRLLRIQKTVDEAKDAKHTMGKDGMRLSDTVELLAEIDNVKDVDKLVELGKIVAKDHSQEIQDFVRHSLLCQ